MYLCYFAFLAQEESITITTYYPSPYGSYNQLQTNSLGVGDNDKDGSLDSGDVPTTKGDVWIRGSVGIGTASPKTKLDVDDAIKVGTRNSCDADREGAIRYNSTDKVMEYCDGSGWKGFGGGCTAPFVILDAPVGERGGCEVVCNNEGHACAFTYQGGTVQPCGFWGRCVCCND